jgi:ribosomal-protein-alanine N-acetyltransferase
MAVLIPLSFRVDGGRVALRAPRVGDATSLRAIRHRSREFLAPWEPRRGAQEETLTALRAAIRHSRTEWLADRMYRFHVVERATGAMVGQVSLSQVFRRMFQNAILGYWIDAAHARRGFTTEAVRLALGVAFGPLGLHRVEAGIIPRNVASLGVARNVGLRQEGHARRYLKINDVWEDHLLFALTAEEWPVASP